MHNLPHTGFGSALLLEHRLAKDDAWELPVLNADLPAASRASRWRAPTTCSKSATTKLRRWSRTSGGARSGTSE